MMQNQAQPNKKRILIIEDDLTLKKLYQKLLRQNNYEVFIASNGEEGLKLIRQGNYDLVLLDIMLPIMDGFEILETIAQEKNHQDFNKIVVLSNLSQEQTIKRAQSLQLRDYIVKSDLNPEEFIQQINNYL